jgi:hypothetical protein
MRCMKRLDDTLLGNLLMRCMKDPVDALFAAA